jgi:hypothetical protein
LIDDKATSLRQVIEGPFSQWMGGSDWTPWFAFLSALSAEPMTEAEAAIYRTCTGRTNLPNKPFRECWCAVGRRGRKSATAAMLGDFFAVYRTWPHAKGETVRVLIVAVSKAQARLTLSYCLAILESVPALKRMIIATDAESISLSNGVQIVVVANSHKSIRGPTVVCAIFEELAFWYDENYANPAQEVLRAVRPSMLTVPDALILGISSPYAKKGLLYEKYRDHYGRDDSSVLIWKADTQTMNPGVDGSIIAAAYADDPIAAAAEYGAEFRNDLEQFLSRDAIDACVSRGVHERPRIDGVKYYGFCDPSGGSRDSFCSAIAHREVKEVILDAVRERKAPLSPEATVQEHSQFFKSYGITTVEGDHYGAGLIRELFSKNGISYRASKANKSEIYLTALPLINSGLVYLLDNPTLINQLTLLERLTSRSGKETVDHPKHGFDDVANSACGALALAARPPRALIGEVRGVGAKIFNADGQIDPPSVVPTHEVAPTPFQIMCKQMAAGGKPARVGDFVSKLFHSGARQ